MRRFQAFLLAAVISLVAVPLCAGSEVDSLRINVELRDDGSAVVTEVWQIDVSDGITEWYLVADNMGRMTIGDLTVSDETGNEYFNEGEWDVDRSRAKKAGRCGLVTRSNGYEICWGVGSSGRHTYTVRYLMTGLVKGHEDMDGFNHMFVTRDLGSSPQSIILTIRKPGREFSTSDTKVWAFGFRGEIHVEDGAVVARTTEPFTRQSAMIAMVGFEKGMFHPELTEKRTFEQVRKKAMKGSDYSDSGAGFWDYLPVLLVGGFVSFCVYLKIRTVKRKRYLLGGGERSVGWFRDTPLGGDLKRTYSILTAFSGKETKERQKLIAAYITRLFYRGAFEIVPQPGGAKPLMRVKDLETDDEADPSSDEGLESRLHSFIKEAAGRDGILQKKELQRWARISGSDLYRWGRDAREKDLTLWAIKPEEARQVFGLKRFLKEFTAIKDRGVVEVKLWNNYLIFAALYGIADKVAKDFRKVCPEYFTLSSEAELLYDDTTTSMVNEMIWMTSRNFISAARAYEASLTGGGSGSSGEGGTSSWGGGGGFSGGGSGGGGR